MLYAGWIAAHKISAAWCLQVPVESSLTSIFLWNLSSSLPFLPLCSPVLKPFSVNPQVKYCESFCWCVCLSSDPPLRSEGSFKRSAHSWKICCRTEMDFCFRKREINIILGQAKQLPLLSQFYNLGLEQGLIKLTLQQCYNWSWG